MSEEGVEREMKMSEIVIRDELKMTVSCYVLLTTFSLPVSISFSS